MVPLPPPMRLVPAPVVYVVYASKVLAMSYMSLLNVKRTQLSDSHTLTCLLSLAAGNSSPVMM